MHIFFHLFFFEKQIYTSFFMVFCSLFLSFLFYVYQSLYALAMPPPSFPLPSWDFLFRFQCILIANSFNVRPCGVHILSYFPVSPRIGMPPSSFSSIFRCPSLVHFLVRVRILSIWHNQIQQHRNRRQ